MRVSCGVRTLGTARLAQIFAAQRRLAWDDTQGSFKNLIIYITI